MQNNMMTESSGEAADPLLTHKLTDSRNGGLTLLDLDRLQKNRTEVVTPALMIKQQDAQQFITGDAMVNNLQLGTVQQNFALSLKQSDHDFNQEPHIQSKAQSPTTTQADNMLINIQQSNIFRKQRPRTSTTVRSGVKSNRRTSAANHNLRPQQDVVEGAVIGDVGQYQNLRYSKNQKNENKSRQTLLGLYQKDNPDPHKVRQSSYHQRVLSAKIPKQEICLSASANNNTTNFQGSLQDYFNTAVQTDVTTRFTKPTSVVNHHNNNRAQSAMRRTQRSTNNVSQSYYLRRSSNNQSEFQMSRPQSTMFSAKGAGAAHYPRKDSQLALQQIMNSQAFLTAQKKTVQQRPISGRPSSLSMAVQLKEKEKQHQSTFGMIRPKSSMSNVTTNAPRAQQSVPNQTNYTTGKLLHQQASENQRSLKSLVQSQPKCLETYKELTQLRDSQNLELMKSIQQTQREQLRMKKQHKRIYSQCMPEDQSLSSIDIRFGSQEKDLKSLALTSTTTNQGKQSKHNFIVPTTNLKKKNAKNRKYSQVQNSRLNKIRSLVDKGLSSSDIPLQKRADIRRQQQNIEVEKVKYEYEKFRHGMEFNLDRYLGTRIQEKAIVLQGTRRNRSNKRRGSIKTMLHESTLQNQETNTPQEQGQTQINQTLFAMQSKVLIEKLSKINLQSEDAVNIDEALRSGNPLKIVVGLSAYRQFLRKMLYQETVHYNPHKLSDRKAGLNDLIKGKEESIKVALLTEFRPDIDYHILGFDIMLETIQSVQKYPVLFADGLFDILIANLNSFIQNIKSQDLAEQIWGYLVNIIEKDPLNGALFVYSLEIWPSIVNQKFDLINGSRKLAYFYSYLVLHAGFNLRQKPLPKESPELIQALLIAFNRAGEDATLAFKERKKSRYHKDFEQSEIQDEQEMEKIDSNVLWAVLAYVARDEDSNNQQCITTFMDTIGAKTIEFSRKCARLLLIYIKPLEDPTIKNGMKMRNKTDEEKMEEMRYNDHRRVLWPLQIQPCLKFIRILVQKSPQYAYQTLTGQRHPSESVPESNLSILANVKQRKVARVVINNFMAHLENEKAAILGLKIALAYVKPHKRWHSQKINSRPDYQKTSTQMYDSLIGVELMKVCTESNLFVRLLTALNVKEYRRSSHELQYLLDVVKFVRNLLKAQSTGLTFEVIRDVRLVQILKIVVKQAIESHALIPPSIAKKQDPKYKPESRQAIYEKLFRQVLNVIEEVTAESSFKDQVIELFKSEIVLLKQLSSLQYTLNSKKLYLRVTKLIKKSFPGLILDLISDALFEFELDLCSMASIDIDQPRVVSLDTDEVLYLGPQTEQTL